MRSTDLRGAVVAAGSLFALGACGGGRARIAAAPPQASHAVAMREPGLEAAMDEQCGGCHNDPASKLPRMGSNLRQDRRLAVRALLYLASDQMPPPPAAMSRAERLALVSSLCRVGTDDPDRCIRINAAPIAGSTFVGGTEFLRILDRTVPVKREELTIAEQQLDNYDQDGALAKADPTIVAMQIVIAEERCSAPPRNANDHDAFSSCVRTILSRELSSLPAPGLPVGGTEKTP